MFELTGRAKFRLVKRDPKNGEPVHLKYFDEEDSNIDHILEQLDKLEALKKERERTLSSHSSDDFNDLEAEQKMNYQDQQMNESNMALNQAPKEKLFFPKPKESEID